jgi:hypothetical protein
MKKSKFPTLIGIILLLLGVAAGVFLIQNQQIFKLGAAAGEEPKSVRVTNITGHSFDVSWVTDKRAAGFIKYGEGESFNQTDLDEITEQSTLHYITVKGLNPSTGYSFKINSGGDDFDNNGAPWQVTTGPELPQPTRTNIISGNVLTASGEAAENVIVYIQAAGASPQSVYTSKNGSWLLSLSQARTQNLSSYASINNQNTLLEISVQAGEEGVSSAQIYPQSAKPVPPMTLGKVHDYKNIPPSDTDEIPEATLELPTGEETDKSSKFNVEEGTTTEKSETVTLDSVDEGEIVTSTSPEFFGEGPTGTKITITIESDPVTDEVTIGNSGSWNWSPPSNLTEGTHKITVSWRDATGVLRTITRTFVVQAAEGPAFESTPSATTSPSPSPTSTPTPAPSITATPTASSTPEPLGDYGSLTPTYLLSIMGIGVLLLSGIASFLAFRKE